MNQEQIDKVLEEPFWPPNLETQQSYITTHDDNDGDPFSGMLQVSISVDGDVWVRTFGSDIHHRGADLRFRTDGGGGKYLKVRNALLLLADAIRQEGDDGQRIGLRM